MKYYVIAILIFILGFAAINLGYENTKLHTTEDLIKSSQEVFSLINETRRLNGIPELNWDEALAKKSVDYSYQMSETGVYIHSTEAGISYSECIMEDVETNIVFNAWMKSPPHQKILLSKNIDSGAVGMGMKVSKVKIFNFEIVYSSKKGYSTFMAR